MKKTAIQKIKKKTVTGVSRRAKPGEKTPAALVARGEPPVVRVVNPKGRGKYVIVCDHASNRVPRALNNLGLSKAELQKHIAWDPGTEDIGLHMSERMDATTVIAGYSRLVVDLNRGDDHPEIMRSTSDHVRIPGNVGLTPAQRRQRMETFFRPYHDEIARALKRFTAQGIAPALISIHSFTPEMDGFKRPWHIGVLWNRQEKLARALVKNLRRNNPDLVIGENEPYSLKATNFLKNTISTHAERRGLPYVIVEFRQDLVDTKKKAVKWADIFLDSLLPALSEPARHVRRRKRA
jgi:predicted N-formylglutamate amidohydrolase